MRARRVIFAVDAEANADSRRVNLALLLNLLGFNVNALTRFARRLVAQDSFFDYVRGNRDVAAIGLRRSHDVRSRVAYLDGQHSENKQGEPAQSTCKINS